MFEEYYLYSGYIWNIGLHLHSENSKLGICYINDITDFWKLTYNTCIKSSKSTL